MTALLDDTSGRASRRAGLLQLLPPDLGRDRVAANLADSAAAAWGELSGERQQPVGDTDGWPNGGVLRVGPSALERAETVHRLRVQRPGWQWVPLVLSEHRQADMVHAVGDAILACLGCRQPVLFTPCGYVTAVQQWAIEQLGRRTPVVIVTGERIVWQRPSAGVWERRWAADRILPGRACWVAPTFRLPPERIARNVEIRSRLGFATDDRIVLAAGDSTRQARHGLLLWAVTILAMLDRRWKLLVCGTGPDTQRLVRFARSTPRPGVLTVASRVLGPVSFGTLLSASDIAVETTDPRSPVGRAVLESVAAEVPTLSTARSRMLPDAVLLPPETSPKTLAQRLLALTDGAALQQHLDAITRAAQALRAEDPVAQWRHVFERVRPSLTTAPVCAATHRNYPSDPPSSR